VLNACEATSQWSWCQKHIVLVVERVGSHPLGILMIDIFHLSMRRVVNHELKWALTHLVTILLRSLRIHLSSDTSDGSPVTVWPTHCPPNMFGCSVESCPDVTATTIDGRIHSRGINSIQLGELESASFGNRSCFSHDIRTNHSVLALSHQCVGRHAAMRGRPTWCTP